MDKVQHAGVAAQSLLKERDGLALHGFLQKWIEPSHMLLEVDELELLHVQPLMDELLGEPLGSRIIEHSLHLLTHDLGIAQLISGCQFEKFFIRQAAPQEEGQSRRQLILR